MSECKGYRALQRWPQKEAAGNGMVKVKGLTWMEEQILLRSSRNFDSSWSQMACISASFCSWLWENFRLSTKAGDMAALELAGAKGLSSILVAWKVLRPCQQYLTLDQQQHCGRFQI